jgi:hypothetical protein
MTIAELLEQIALAELQCNRLAREYRSCIARLENQIVETTQTLRLLANIRKNLNQLDSPRDAADWWKQ